MIKMKFNDCIFDVDTRYMRIEGTFIFYVKDNRVLNLVKSCHNKINECEFIYPSGKIEKKDVLFKDFRSVGYNNYGYISTIIAIAR